MAADRMAKMTPQSVEPGLDDMWQDVQVVDQTGSTNADLIAAAASGAPEGTVLVAYWQSSGRGRLDRVWDTPAGTSLTFSYIVRPAVPIGQTSWLPILAGLAVYNTLRVHDVDCALKWPNDVQLGPQRLKCGGILVQMAAADPPAFVVGIGLNVRTHGGLSDTAAAIDTQWTADGPDLLVGVLNEFTGLYQPWVAAGGDAEASGVLAAYRAACRTIGERVRVFLPGAETPVEGTATDVDDQGRLVVDIGEAQPLVVGAGDVVHVRPA